MKGAVSRRDLVESGILGPGMTSGWVTGLVPVPDRDCYGIRKGRTARRVRRCLRREWHRASASAAEAGRACTPCQGEVEGGGAQQEAVGQSAGVASGARIARVGVNRPAWPETLRETTQSGGRA